MKGTPTQLTCRGALHGYPKISAFTSLYVLMQDMNLYKLNFLGSIETHFN